MHPTHQSSHLYSDEQTLETITELMNALTTVTNSHRKRLLQEQRPCIDTFHERKLKNKILCIHPHIQKGTPPKDLAFIATMLVKDDIQRELAKRIVSQANQFAQTLRTSRSSSATASEWAVYNGLIDLAMKELTLYIQHHGGLCNNEDLISVRRDLRAVRIDPELIRQLSAP